MRSLLALATALLALGCRAPAPTPQGIDPLTADEIRFPTTYRNHPTEVALTWFAEQPHPRLRIKPPFELVDGPLVKGPIRLRFNPTAQGLFRDVLWVEGKNAGRMVSVSGEAQEDCVKEGFCRRTRFRPDLGRCEEEVDADGSACADKCVLDGRCAQGRCVGTTRDCDDGIDCTEDDCFPTVGCSHNPFKGRCVPSDPRCGFVTCDKDRGCVEIPATSDGGGCGDDPCPRTSICLQGRCRDLFRASRPCGWSDVQDPLPMWEYGVGRNKASVSLVSVDAEGNLILADRELNGATPWSLLSLSRDGQQRWRTPLAWEPAPGLDGGVRSLVDGDLLVAAISETSQVERTLGVEAHRTRDGSLAWSRPLLPTYFGDLAADAALATKTSLVRSGTDELSVVVGKQDGLAFLLSLQASDGAPLMRVEVPAPLPSARNSLLTDGQGRVFYGSASFELVAAESGTGTLWKLPIPRWIGFDGLALDGDRLLVPGVGVVRASDGTVLTELPISDGLSSRTDGERLWWVSTTGDPECGKGEMHTEALASDEGGTSCAIEGLVWSAAVLASSRSSVLITGWSLEENKPQLVEIDTTGTTRHVWRLPTLAISGLHAGRIFLAKGNGLATFDLSDPSLDVAPHGWVAAGGNLQRTGAPR